MNRLRPPEAVIHLVEALERAGFETWCVGGAVRDALMGQPHLDWDLATAARPEQVQGLFRRTVPIGIRFGTVGVLDRDGRMHEVTTFRRDLETDGRHAVVRFGTMLEEDLGRRDFTINAIAYSPSRDELRDPFDGRGDISRRVIRTVGTAVERMSEDRLRALRAIRFATRFGFTIESHTWAAIQQSAPHLGRLSPERVRQELEKTVEQVPRPSEALRMWETSGAFATLVPPLVGTDAVLRESVDYLPLPRSARRPRRQLNRLTALFLGVSAGALPGLLRDLRFSNSDASAIAETVRHWQQYSAHIEQALMAPEGGALPQARNWVAQTGRLGIGPLLRLSYAVWCARRAAGLPSPEPSRVRSAYRMLSRIAFHDPVEIADLAVDGEDLIRAGIPPGPRLGIILRALLAIVVENPSLNTHAALTAAAVALSRSHTDPVKEP